MIETLKYLLSAFVGSFITWFFTKWVPEHPEYGEKIFYYLLNLVPFVFTWKQRKRIEKEIHGYITEEIKSINKEAYDFKILPKGIKIEWTLKKKEEIIIEQNEILIRLGSRANLCENFVDALILYLSNSFMPSESIYLEPTLYEACKFQVAISMLKKRSKEHYQVFIDKYYKHGLEKYEGILNYNEKLENIEKSGFLISSFFPVLSFYADKWISQRKAPSAEIKQDINELLDFIHNISIKKEYEAETGEEPPLTYEGRYLKIGIVLVARKDLAVYRPHFEAAREKLKSGVDILFVKGRGRHVASAKTVALRLKKEPFCEQIGSESKFYFYPEENRKIEGICYAFKRKT